ncbi:cytochrome P450 [Streptomyces sp. NPDC006879]|uniref:cytochrome P450 family protein n=1 Tax=Streptomyces sp. NPDC006879 TaxID=3364767 RepID=UPI0036824935
MPVHDLTTYAADFNENPYPHYARLLQTGPVHRVRLALGHEVWLVVGHEEARQALMDPLLSKNWRLSPHYQDAPFTAFNTNMLESDPPRHTRLRRLVAREFTARRVEALRPRVQQITDHLLEKMTAAGARRADLVGSFAFPLPMTVICELLGVPDLDRDAFRRWSNELVAPTSSQAEAEATAAMLSYLEDLIAAKEGTPGEDLLSALIRTRDEDGDRLGPQELVGMAFLLLVAGHETTVNLIANGVRALLDHPEQLAALRADPEGLIDGAVEEMLRYDGPVESATFRLAVEDMYIGDAPVRAGESVMISLAAGDHDPDRFAAPDSFDIHRVPQPHLAFGHGIHYCLGAPLARMEGRIAVSSLLRCCPELRADPEAGPYEWIPGTLIRGVRALPVCW